MLRFNVHDDDDDDDDDLLYVSNYCDIVIMNNHSNGIYNITNTVTGFAKCNENVNNAVCTETVNSLPATKMF